jgi:hypothetical protein
MANPQCEGREDTVKGRWRFSSAGDQTVVGFKMNIFFWNNLPKITGLCLAIFNATKWLVS